MDIQASSSPVASFSALTEDQSKRHTHTPTSSVIQVLANISLAAASSVTWFTTSLAGTLFLSYFIKARAANETLAR